MSPLPLSNYLCFGTITLGVKEEKKKTMHISIDSVMPMQKCGHVISMWGKGQFQNI